jgi:hypothetical protein
METFLVICYDSDDQATFIETVEASTAEAATKLAFHRADTQSDCAWHVGTFRKQDLEGFLKLIEAGEPSARKHYPGSEE